MDRKNFYFGQIVTESDLDQVFDWAEDADRDQSVDQALTGIHAGLAVSEQAVPDMTVQVTGGTATSPDGERINEAAPTTTVDCAVDRYGLSTAVTAAGDEKYLAVYVRFARNETNPAVDDNGVTVFTRAYEDSEFIVEQGAQAVVPTAVPPVLLTDAVHLCDIHLLHAQVAVTNADIDEARRGDWLREVLANRGTTAVYGTPQSACADLWQVVDALAGAGGADDVGADDYTTANAHVAWAGATTQDALEATADAIDGHIVGAAPNHPAGAITTVPIVGTPESEGLASDVQAVFDNVYGHLNDRTERAISERVTATWDMFDDSVAASDDAVSRLRGEFMTGTQYGGSWPKDAGLMDIARRLNFDNPIGSPILATNTIDFTGVRLGGVALVVRNSVGFPGRQLRALAVVSGELGGADTGQGGACSLVDPHTTSTVIAGPVALAGLPSGAGQTWRAKSVCSSGSALYVLFADASGTQTWRVQAYDATDDALPILAGWSLTGINPTPGFTGATGTRAERIIMASETRVATLNGHIALDVAGRPAISVFNASDGLGLLVGDGDVTPGVGVYTSGGFCSDGTYLYWTAVDVALLGTIQSAQVANPDAGRVGWTAIGLATASGALENPCWDLCWTGESVVAPCEDGTLRAASTVNLSAASSVYAVHAKFAKLRWACFDGLKVWIFGISTGDVACGIGIDASLVHSPSTAVVGLAELAPTIVPTMTVAEGIGSPLVDVRDLGPAVWDGDAVWQIVNDGAMAGLPAQLGLVRAIRASSRR